MMAASEISPGAFDNKSSKSINLWGSYNTWIIPRSGNLELYYLGIHKKDVRFEDGLSMRTDILLAEDSGNMEEVLFTILKQPTSLGTLIKEISVHGRLLQTSDICLKV